MHNTFHYLCCAFNWKIHSIEKCLHLMCAIHLNFQRSSADRPVIQKCISPNVQAEAVSRFASRNLNTNKSAVLLLHHENEAALISAYLMYINSGQLGQQWYQCPAANSLSIVDLICPTKVEFMVICLNLKMFRNFCQAFMKHPSVVWQVAGSWQLLSSYKLLSSSVWLVFVSDSVSVHTFEH